MLDRLYANGDSMDFLTGTILSGMLYDLIKCGIMLSSDNLKDKLKDWVIDDSTLLTLSSELTKLELTNDLSELAIENRVLASPEITTLIEKIQPNSSNNIIIQTHNGTGDNIGGDKIIYSGK